MKGSLGIGQGGGLLRTQRDKRRGGFLPTATATEQRWRVGGEAEQTDNNAACIISTAAALHDITSCSDLLVSGAAGAGESRYTMEEKKKKFKRQKWQRGHVMSYTYICEQLQYIWIS